MFTDADSRALVEQAFVDGTTATGQALTLVTFGPGYETLLSQAQTPATLPLIAETDLWTIPYTSGTAGKPKGVMLSHRSRMPVGLICAAEFGCFGPTTGSWR